MKVQESPSVYVGMEMPRGVYELPETPPHLPGTLGWSSAAAVPSGHQVAPVQVEGVCWLATVSRPGIRALRELRR